MDYLYNTGDIKLFCLHICPRAVQKNWNHYSQNNYQVIKIFWLIYLVIYLIINKVVLVIFYKFRRLSKCPRPYELYSVDLNRSCDPEIYLQREINNFSSQLHHSTMSFNACGFFLIDNKLLRSVNIYILFYLHFIYLFIYNI